MAVRRGHSGRVDVNQAEIVEALRKAGYSVLSLAQIGNGAPDLLVSGRGLGRNVLMEVKQPGAKLTADEVLWHHEWPARVWIVRSIEDALDAVRDAWD